MYFLPESPVWLRSKKRYEEADKSTAWLKLQMVTIPMPVETVKKIATIELDKSEEGKEEKQKLRNIIFTRPLLMPLAIGLTLLVLQQVSGIDAIIFFTVEIFRASGK